MTLTLEQAQAVIAGAINDARKRSAKPLAVIVLDAGAHPIAFAREDGASLLRLDVARAKAHGAIGMDADTAVLAERAKANPTFFQSLAVALEGKIAFSPGGVVIRDRQGTAIGAVGISGDTGECDQACAVAGLVAAGLVEEKAQ